MKKILTIVAAFSLGSFCQQAVAQARQDTNKPAGVNVQNSITANVFTLISSNSNYSILKQAIIKTRLDTTLNGIGPFTVFAPVNAAFEKLPKTKTDSLMRFPSKMAAMLKGHIVPGRYTKSDLIKLLIAGKGTATLNTIDGQLLTLSVNANKNLTITNDRGFVAQVSSFDVIAGNGLVHSLTGVLLK